MNILHRKGISFAARFYRLQKSVAAQSPSPLWRRMTVGGREHPHGGVCTDPLGSCPLRGLDAPHRSSNWFGKGKNKTCRACYGRLKQRKGSASRSRLAQAALVLTDPVRLQAAGGLRDRAGRRHAVVAIRRRRDRGDADQGAWSCLAGPQL